MLVNRQARPNNAQVEKGLYFRTGKHLYYVLDRENDGEYLLIEDCRTNRVFWWTEGEFTRTKKQIIRP
jgi:hypothetical protein